MNTIRRSGFGKVWRFEQWKDRRMLSVSAILSRGNLLIRDGVDQWCDDFKVIEDVTRDVIIRIGGGDDNVWASPFWVDSARPAVVPRDLRVEMGLGENMFWMLETNVGRDAIFRNIGELNVAGLEECEVGRDVRIRGRDGMDRNYFQTTTVTLQSTPRLTRMNASPWIRISMVTSPCKWVPVTTNCMSKTIP